MDKIKKCGFCGEEKVIAARGLCRACYQRYLKNGTPEYTKVKHKCQIDGCDDFVVSHGLCDKHRKRFERHGHTVLTRENGWGSKAGHPLHEMWMWRKRTNQLSGEWLDFWQFVEDVGERPSKDHTIKAIHKGAPLSKDNCMWATPVRKKRKDESFKKYCRNYQREWRRKNPIKVKQIDLKKMFNITLEDYDAMFEKQSGVCAICGEPESVYKYMPVDHDHETGKIRGLLCSHCNKALGGFKDDAKILQNAINYLNT